MLQSHRSTLRLTTSLTGAVAVPHRARRRDLEGFTGASDELSAEAFVFSAVAEASTGLLLLPSVSDAPRSRWGIKGGMMGLVARSFATVATSCSSKKMC